MIITVHVNISLLEKLEKKPISKASSKMFGYHLQVKLVQDTYWKYDDRLKVAKKRKLIWYGYISRVSGMAKTILQGIVKETKRRRIQTKNREDYIIKDWTRLEFLGFVKLLGLCETETSSLVPRRPSILKD